MATRKQTKRSIHIERLEKRELMATVPIRVSIENLSPLGGLAATPLWVGFHDGNFEIGRVGRPADQFGGLELIAEEGDASQLGARFDSVSPNGIDAVLGAPGGFAGAPVIEPGEKASQTINVPDSRRNRYFSFASMVIPSNDAFFANLDSRRYEVFDRGGGFRGPFSIDIFGDNLWDAGTEVNNPRGGAAFSTEGGDPQTENLGIRPLDSLDNFIGTGLPTGQNLASTFRRETPLYRITVTRADRADSPVDRSGPRATLEANDVLTTGATTHAIRVIYSDPSGIDTNHIGTDDLRIHGRNGRELRVTSVTTDATPNVLNRQVIATYTLTPRDGSFDFDDNGRYRVELRHDALRDLIGNRIRASELGEIHVNVGTGLQVTIENLAPSDGLLLTPFWVGLHDGRFEVGREGSLASSFGGLELIAEEGASNELAARFDATSSGVDLTIAAPGGFAGAPVFQPGESATQTIDVRDPRNSRYFSYASMLIPSNDAFIANLDSRAFELFDRQGKFRGPITIHVFGRNVWDAGTEVNRTTGGAAFSALGGTSTSESLAITQHSGLDAFVGTVMANGDTLGSAYASRTPIARITISLASNPSGPIDRHGPEALLTASDVSQSAPFHEIRVTYYDPSGVNVTRINSDNLTIIGRNGRRLQVSLVETNAQPGTNPRTVVATYRLTSSRGSFANSDATTYTVSLRHNTLSDLAGNRNQFQELGRFRLLRT